MQADPLKRAIDTIIQVAQPDQIILFGSHARGDNTPDSDYDLLVLKAGAQKTRELSQQIYLNFKNIGAPIDVLVVESGKYEQLKADSYTIYSEIAKNGKVIYEKQ